MKYIAILLPALLTSACLSPQIKYVPVYLQAQPEKPEPPKLENVDVNYQALTDLFVLTPENFNNLINNNIEIEKYIELLIEGWKYYESATKPASE